MAHRLQRRPHRCPLPRSRHPIVAEKGDQPLGRWRPSLRGRGIDLVAVRITACANRWACSHRSCYLRLYMGGATNLAQMDPSRALACAGTPLCGMARAHTCGGRGFLAGAPPDNLAVARASELSV